MTAPNSEPHAASPLAVTPLVASHKELGAKMAGFAGYEMPIQYAGVIAEHKSVRESAGMFDVSHMGHCIAEDVYISRHLSRPLEKIPVGRSQYALIMNEQGGIIDDCISYRLDDRRWHIILNASRKEIDIRTLDRVTPRPELAMIAVQGPRVVPLLGEICPRRSFAMDREILGVRVYLTARTGYTGEDGFEFVVDGSAALALWRGLLATGIAPCGLAARDLLRIEAGLPLYGSDITETTSPFETGLDFAVDLDRDFVASKALATPPRRRRAGIALEKGALPRHDYAVLGSDERPIGVVTSGTFSPLLGYGIALALVERDAAPAYVEIRNKPCRAREVPLPFYRRRK